MNDHHKALPVYWNLAYVWLLRINSRLYKNGMTKPIKRAVLINSTTLAPCPNSHELNLLTDDSINRIKANGLLMTGEVNTFSVLPLNLCLRLLIEGYFCLDLF